MQLARHGPNQLATEWSYLPGENPLKWSHATGGRHEMRRRKRVNLMHLPPEQLNPPPEDGLADVLAKLPWNERAAIVLRFYGDASYREIADFLGCPEGSVGPWINRGLDRLRRALHD